MELSYYFWGAPFELQKAHRFCAPGFFDQSPQLTSYCDCAVSKCHGQRTICKQTSGHCRKIIHGPW